MSDRDPILCAKPCPFCGGVAKLSLQKFPGCGILLTVYCDACGAWGPGGSKDPTRAVAYWNVRDGDGEVTP